MGRNLLLTTLVSALVSALSTLAVLYLLSPHLPVPTVEVPQIVGLSPEQARGLLEPRGLLLVIDGEKPDATVPAGSVLHQQPLGGSRFRRGDLVHAVLARAPNTAKVPPTAGLTADQARDVINQAGLNFGKVSEAASATIAKGVVLSSTPASGAEVPPGTAVDVSVSSGPASSNVPKVVGKRLAAAKELLVKAGFVVGAIRYGSHDDYDQGVVISQTPAADAPAPPGSKVDVTVND